MIDISLVRENPEFVRENLKRRKDEEKIKLLDLLIEADKKWRKLKTQLDKLRHERNEMSRKIAELKKEGKPVDELLRKAAELPSKIKELERKVREEEEKVRKALLSIPNILHETVPYGEGEEDNVEIRRWGEPPKFDFEPKDHLTILKNLGLIEQERAARAASSGFFYMKDELVLLDLALQKFAIDFLRKKGYVLVEPPFMINRKAYEGMIDPSDFEMVTYKIENEDLYLIATAEHPIGAMFMGEVIDKKDLPMKFC